MSQKNNYKNTSRRHFLKSFGVSIGAAGAVTGLGLLSACSNKDEEAVDMLTVDGKLIKAKTTEVKINLTELQARGREGLAGKKFVMVVDLSKCRNARKCMSACQSAHQLKPEQHHINVLQMENAKGTGFYYQPKPCMHCDNPPCTKVCPVDATFKRQDGIVLIDNERCIGCRFCIAACPYSARVFNWSEPKPLEGKEDMLYDVEQNIPQKKGTISKCLFSADQLRLKKLPHCVSACPNGTYWFGDEEEDAVTNGTSKETVRLSKLLADNGAYTLMPELGTKPRVYYLPPKDRLFEFKSGGLNYLGEEEIKGHI